MNSLCALCRHRFTVCVTTYEMAANHASILRKVPWQCVVVDEAHRLKNRNSKLAVELFSFQRECVHTCSRTLCFTIYYTECKCLMLHYLQSSSFFVRFFRSRATASPEGTAFC